MSLGSKIKNITKRELRAVQSVILQEFKRRTPGYGKQHIIAEDAKEHEHTTYGSIPGGGYVGDVANSWQFLENAPVPDAIAAITNAHPAIALVEYGFFKGGKFVHEGGHRIISSTMKAGNVTRLYSAAASKALIVALANENYGGGGGAKQASASLQGVKASGGKLSLVAKKKRVKIDGGGSFPASDLRRFVNKVTDSLVDSINAGQRQAIKQGGGGRRRTGRYTF